MQFGFRKTTKKKMQFVPRPTTGQQCAKPGTGRSQLRAQLSVTVTFSFPKEAAQKDLSHDLNPKLCALFYELFVEGGRKKQKPKGTVNMSGRF